VTLKLHPTGGEPPWEPWKLNQFLKFPRVGDGQRADVIVEVAGRLFFAPGFARVSMDDLARELGMSKKTIYRHFPGKRSLLAAVLDR
jgi:AcrR family transcriptional regulator